MLLPGRFLQHGSAGAAFPVFLYELSIFLKHRGTEIAEKMRPSQLCVFCVSLQEESAHL